jgi:hypothetical protein
MHGLPDTKTLHLHLRAGRLPQPDIRLGRHMRWRPSTIARWKANQTVTANVN